MYLFCYQCCICIEDNALNINLDISLVSKYFPECRSSLCTICRFLGSGPDRGRSPVEWGDFPYVCSSVRPFIRPPSQARSSRHEAQPTRAEAQPTRLEGQIASQASGLRLQAWLAGPQAWLDGPEGVREGRMNEKSPHSTGLRPLLGLLPCFPL